MTFLALIGALLLEQWRPLRTGNRLYLAFARYVNRIAQNFNAGRYRDGVISWLLAVVPVALVTLLVYVVSRHVNGLLALAWNIVVLYLALGFRQFSHFYNDIMLALRIHRGTACRRNRARRNRAWTHPLAPACIRRHGVVCRAGAGRCDRLPAGRAARGPLGGRARFGR